ncbi:DUF7452 domain-containing protein [Halioxenophilus aromaticivorans]|uniref:DUF7452 domain-containing protein n=1 Tax=Halioxenophilus aromaticivorans TaxID=1306992 RepID=A0AAV3TWM8_9ALTE
MPASVNDSQVRNVVMFKHTATRENTRAHITTLSHPDIDSNSGAVLLIAQCYGVYNANEVGLWFDQGRWHIFNQTRVGIPIGSEFFVCVITAQSQQAFSIVAEAHNTNGHMMDIRSPLGEINRDDCLFLTQVYGQYNVSPIGVWWSGEGWTLFNEDRSPLPLGCRFNVLVLRPGHNTFNGIDLFVGQHRERSGGSHISLIQPLLPDSLRELFTTNCWRGTYNAHSTGVWFNGSGWTIFNQDLAEILPDFQINFFMPLSTSSGGEERDDSLIALVADHHGADYSPAAIDIESQFGSQPGRHNLSETPYRYSMHEVDTGGMGPHFQGVSFLRDTLLDEGGTTVRFRRGVYSYNYGEGLMISCGILNSGATEGITAFDSNHVVNFLDRKTLLNIRYQAAVGNHEHPGGIQAHGDTIAIAMEESVSGGAAAVYFIKVEGVNARLIGALPLGSGGAPNHLNTSKAAAAAFLKLTNGFLVAVSGSDYGKDGIWFYRSWDNEIRNDTEWCFIDYWTPERLPGGVCDIDAGKASTNCFVGADGGLSLLACSTGGIYIMASIGTHGGGVDDEYVQLFKVVGQSQSGGARVDLEPVWVGKHKVGRLALKQYSMRWAGAALTTATGTVMLLNSERGSRKQGNRDTSDGKIWYLGR